MPFAKREVLYDYELFIGQIYNLEWSMFMTQRKLDLSSSRIWKLQKHANFLITL